MTARGAERMRSPEAWLAVLRVVIGAWFLKSVITKWSWNGRVPEVAERWIGFLPERLAEYAAGNPIGWYRNFLEEVAIPNAETFAHLTAIGEAAAGLGLVLGLRTPWAAGIALALSASYGLANFWAGPSQQGFHLLLVTALIAILAAGGGRRWSVDAALARGGWR